jgi:CubicO group peptidase (beta-lactamase class C family)
MRDEVLAPLVLTRTALEDVTRPAAGRATPYELDARNRPVRAPYHDVSWRWPAGGFLSTAPDLARFGSAFVGGSFVSPQTVALFTAEQPTRAGAATGYALGWETRGGYVRHIGNTVGGTAALLVHVASSTALALTTNVGYVTAPAPRVAPGTPEPPQILLPFMEAR